MVVYIEYLFVDNFIFDYLLLCLTLRKKTERRKKYRIFISSFFGSIVTLLFPYLNLNKFLLFLMKVSLAFCMIALACKYNNFKEYILCVNFFVLLTFIFGGVISGLLSLLEIDYYFLYGSSNGIVPLGLMLLIGILLYTLCEKGFKRLFEKKLIYPFVRKCVLYKNGLKIKTVGFIDSGNTLRYNGEESVCIAGDKLVENIYIQGFFENEECDCMMIDTVSGKSIIKIYEIDKLEIYFNDKKNTIYNVKIGIPSNALKLGEDYQLILSSEFITQ